MKYKNVPFSSVKPLGENKKNMQADLNSFIGNLDDLAKDLIKDDDIYGKNRRCKNTTEVDVGAKDVGQGFMSQHMWWNAETQGNWLDGFIRTAILTEDKMMMNKAEKYINHYLDTQDADGYIGIYQNDIRFNHCDENGEMWAQVTILRAIIAYYEYTKNINILNSVKKAVQQIMLRYNINGKNPFDIMYTENDISCGLGHSLMIVDVFEKLYSVTNDKSYLKYAEWLYSCFSEVTCVNTDVSSRVLLDVNKPFNGHAAHTYEQLRAVIIACRSNPDKYKRVLDNYLAKLETCICPSGGPIGDEMICGRIADATNTGYEYCSVQELFHSYIKLYEYTNDLNYIQKAEWLFYNAAMGMQFRTSGITTNTSISYLKSDNSFAMCGIFHTEDKSSKQLRYKYSPTHQDAAVCCVPNAGRIYTYFHEYMWYQCENVLLKLFYGASSLSTIINDVEVEIIEKSDFPYSNKLEYEVHLSDVLEFEIRLRIPQWATGIQCSIEYKVENEFVIIKKAWATNESFSLEFTAEPKINKDLVGDIYFTYGALVFALEIQYIEKISKYHNLEGYVDIYCSPEENQNWNLSLKSDIFAKYDLVNNQPTLQVELVSKLTNQNKIVALKPMGSLALRRVTFNIEES